MYSEMLAFELFSAVLIVVPKNADEDKKTSTLKSGVTKLNKFLNVIEK